MPGTIKDPRMNDEEMDIGVVIFDGVYAVYDKNGDEGDENTRYYPAGWKLNKSASSYEDKDDLQLSWNGIRIYRKITKFVSKPDNRQGKVVLKIKEFLESNPRKIWDEVQPQNLGGHGPRNEERAEKTMILLRDK